MNKQDHRAAEAVLTGTPYTTGDTSLTITSGRGQFFNDTSTSTEFEILIINRAYAGRTRDAIEASEAEFCTVTARSTDTFTVTRGTGGSTAIELDADTTWLVYQVHPNEDYNTVADAFSVDNALTLQERSSDPSDPSEGNWVIWMSDGTGSGDDGDLMVKITSATVTKTITIIDFSAS